MLAVVAGALAALIVALAGFDNHPLSLDNPPKTFQAAVGIGAFAFGIVLLLVESVRALTSGIGLAPLARQTSVRLPVPVVIY